MFSAFIVYSIVRVTKYSKADLDSKPLLRVNSRFEKYTIKLSKLFGGTDRISGDLYMEPLFDS